MQLAPVSVKIEPGVKERIKKLAEARRRTPHWLMREAIHQYVEREERREAARQEALAAWNEYQATGRHVTHGEADAWMAELERGHDTEPPECHD